MSDQTIDFQKAYESLAGKVRLMIETQRAYFKSNKDIQLLKKAKAMESEVYKEVNPVADQKKPQQTGE